MNLPLHLAEPHPTAGPCSHKKLTLLNIKNRLRDVKKIEEGKGKVSCTFYFHRYMAA
jgi:hypothetical protein